MDVKIQKARFINAASSGDVRDIEKLLKSGLEVPPGALYFASLNGQTKVIAQILKAARFGTSELDKSLCAAIEGGHQRAAARLLESAANPNATDGVLRRPALLSAVKKGFDSLVEYLLKRGANPNCHEVPVGASLLGSSVGWTPLMAAASKGNVAMVKRLLIAGADPTLRGSDGKTAFDKVPKGKIGAEVTSVLKDWSEEGSHKERVQHLSISKRLEKPPTSWTEALAWIEQHMEATRRTKARHEILVVFPFRLEVAQSFAGHKPSKAIQHASLEAYLAGLECVKQVMIEVRASWFLQFTHADGALLCGLPDTKKWNVLALFKTACANYGVSHSALLKFLRSLERDHSFDVVECDETSVGGCFKGKLEKPLRIARKLFAFCPFIADSDGGDLNRFAKRLVRTGYFKIWWD